MSIPRVAIVGRPNVGKSTIFNRLLKKKEAIIHQTPGITRDRKSKECLLLDEIIFLTDTGGIFSSDDDNFMNHIDSQVNTALDESDFVLLVVDAQGLTGGDRELGELVRKSDKPTLVVANKCDRIKNPDDISEFYELGFDSILGISAEHRINVNQFTDLLYSKLKALKLFKKVKKTEPQNSLSFSLIGRPNVGKSSLLNKILNKDRAIVTPIAGTTRDSIEDHFIYKDVNFKIIDTAGLRRKSKVKESIEFYSTVRAKKSIHESDLTVLLIEPGELITDQDKKICDIVSKEGKSLVFVINKWDLIEEENDETKFLHETKSKIRFQFPALHYVPIITMSAITGRGIKKLLNLLLLVYNNTNFQIDTPKLNKFVESRIRRHLPSKKGKQLKVYYATQVKTAPPTFIFFVNSKKIVTSQFERYITNTMRNEFDFKGTPLVIKFKDRQA